MSHIRPIWRCLLIATVLATLALVTTLTACYLAYTRSPEAPTLSTGPNAAWFAHEWVGAEQSDERYSELAARLTDNRIVDAYFHVGPLQADGTIAPGRYRAATRLLRELYSGAPAIRPQAWIGQVEKSGGGPLDLSRAEVRTVIVATAARFLDLGFAGIHVNIEPSTGNPHLLELLAEIRDRTAQRRATLSIAADELEPIAGIAWLTRVAGTRAGFWTEAYYRAVLARVDQVAVMMYDTGLPTDWLYGALVKWQTAAIRAIAGPGVTVYIGVPTYEERRLSFHPGAENMRTALRGIRQGLHDVPPGARARFGVAIYADWTTDDAEWRQYRANWLGISP